jgi:hypothetical protein
VCEACVSGKWRVWNVRQAGNNKLMSPRKKWAEGSLYPGRGAIARAIAKKPAGSRAANSGSAALAYQSWRRGSRGRLGATLRGRVSKFGVKFEVDVERRQMDGASVWRQTEIKSSRRRYQLALE